MTNQEHTGFVGTIPVAWKTILDIALLVVLVGLMIFGSLRLAPWMLGAPSPSIRAVLIATVLPVGAVLILSLLERALPAAGPRKAFRQWFLHVQIMVFFTFMVGLSVVLASIVLAAASRKFGIQLGIFDLRFMGGGGLLALLAAGWVIAILNDFFFYWYHRALHTFPVLWAHHKLHHMDRELDAVTLTRANWMEAFLAAVAIVVPMMVLFKVNPLDPWSLGLISGISATVLNTLLTIGHMNVKLGAGRANILWCTPQVHRIHHSRLPQHRDKNFAFTLPLWDRLFGTYYAPAPDEYPPTGVDGEKEINSFWESQIFTQREWWRMFQRWRQGRYSSVAAKPRA